MEMALSVKTWSVGIAPGGRVELSTRVPAELQATEPSAS